jgi:hypothetical protein
VKLFDKIKEQAGKSTLKNNLKSRYRKRFFHNFNTAKTVGLLFDATDHSIYETARSFSKFFAERKIKLTGLGFADSKEVMNFYQYYTGFNFFTLKDTNWQGIPRNHNVNDFMNEKVDILIDIHFADNFQLDYINAMSEAEFKIGPYSSNVQQYDFMIDISSNPSAEFFCDQVIHYLNIINNSYHEPV